MAVSGRLYSSSFTNVSVSVVQDIFSILCGAGKIIGIQSIELGQITAAAVQSLRLRVRYAAALTQGSGGSVLTAEPYVPGDAASAATVHANDITQSVSTMTSRWSDQWNLLNGFIWVPPIVGRPPLAGPGGGFVVSLDSAPTSPIFVSGTIIFEELP